MNQLNDDTFNIPGISTRRRSLLAKLGIKSSWDLIHLFPRDYEDWTNPKPSEEFIENSVETFIATVENNPVLSRKGKLTILKTTLHDLLGQRIFATWFNQPYFQNKLVPTKKYIFRGKIKKNGLFFETINPVFEIFNENASVKIEPIYPLTAGMTQGVLRRLVNEALEIELKKITDCLPDKIRMKYKLCSAVYAYEKIHRPQSEDEFLIARKRLAFEELFMIQAGLKLVKSSVAQSEKGIPLNIDNTKVQRFYKSLPFKLTDSQLNVIKDILIDISKKNPMNRLVQGDVGSGKTVIAAAAVAVCFANDKQVALMAPTAVLAHQHYVTFKEFFKGKEDQIALLTGSVTGKNRKNLLSRLESGEIKLLIGTHAVIQKGVEFKNLALTITDEQHRFGVEQRSRLGKSLNTIPHVLVMSATPIPRTLGFVLYGDLDTSMVKGLPSGRHPIETYTATSKDDDRIYKIIDRYINEGRQAYIVCPMIEATLDSDLLSAKELYENLSENAFSHRSVGLIHGTLKAKEKDTVMKAFMEGEIQVLVSTTVIEVGVDNPNAAVMLIQNAERFGLAQLHQLRGRIGRGPYKSLCILKSDLNSPQVKERLKILCKSSDGFYIAEKDLQLRGTGDFFGTRQHGIPDLKIANLYRDTELLEESREAVLSIFENDPLLQSPENRGIIPFIKRKFGGLLDNIGI